MTTIETTPRNLTPVEHGRWCHATGYATGRCDENRDGSYHGAPKEFAAHYLAVCETEGEPPPMSPIYDMWVAARRELDEQSLIEHEIRLARGRDYATNYQPEEDDD